ncbi:MAG: hypothetical protein ABIP36_08915 [Acidimicrobiales bacterium]
MLVLLSFALVLVATVLLVLGLLNEDGLTLIYISIASSVAAAVVLMIALRRNKPRAEAAAPPEPLPSTPAATPVDSLRAASMPTEPAPTEPAGDSEWLATDWEETEEVDFPIADYDDLTAGQILPLLPQLYADEVEVVDARERDTKSRPEILDRLAELSGGAAATTVPTADASSAAPAAAASPSGWEDDAWFPIEDYESLSAAQIRPMLGELDPEELRLVRTRELGLGRRRSLVDDIDRRLGTAGTPAPTTPPAKKAPLVKKSAAPVRKALVKKAAAPAKKPASPVRKAPVKKPPPVKKSAVPPKKAPVKKAAAPVKKALVKKAPAKPAVKRR